MCKPILADFSCHLLDKNAERLPHINVLNVETEPRMGDGENWTNRKFGKLISRKLASWPVFQVKCRKVTMHKCSYLNVLNIETEPRMGDMENWTNRKFVKLNQRKICISVSFLSFDRNGISASAIKKKLKNGCHFINIDCTEKFQITNPPPKFGSPVFGASMEKWKQNISSHYEKIEKWSTFHKYRSYWKISNYLPPPPTRVGQFRKYQFYTSWYLLH